MERRFEAVEQPVSALFAHRTEGISPVVLATRLATGLPWRHSFVVGLLTKIGIRNETMLVLTFFGDRGCPTDRWRGLIDEYSGVDDLSSLAFKRETERAPDGRGCIEC